MSTSMPAPLTAEQVDRFEDVVDGAVESLMRPIAALPGNPQGYAFFRAGDVRAHLSTNPYARWTCGTYGIERAPAETVTAVVEFFRSHGVPPSVRVPPVGMTVALADRLRDLGLRHTSFHTVLYAPLPLPPRSSDGPGVEVREVTEPDEFDEALHTEIEGWGIPREPDSPLVAVRRTWRKLAGHHAYLATCDGSPAGAAMLYCANGIGYLARASTIERFRRRGVQSALIRRRIADATAAGCTMILGGAEFCSTSCANMMRAGLRVAYTAAIWEG